MSIRSRLASLERAVGSAGCGPDCPPRPFVFVRDRNFYGLGETHKPPVPAPCPRCGRAAEPTVVRFVRDPNFYGTADRLLGLGVKLRESIDSAAVTP